MYSGLDFDVDPFPLQFCAEAEELWTTQQSVDSTLNIVAAHFLSLGYLGQGRDHLVLFYLRQAMHMGTRMGLFNAQNNEGPSLAELTEDIRSEYEYAAWGTFNWITYVMTFPLFG